MRQTKILYWGLLLTIPILSAQAQRAMTVNDLVNWKRITRQTISNDGRWAACIMAPWKGDAEVQLYSTSGKAVASYTPATEVNFSSGSGYAIIKNVPALQLTDSLKLKNTPKQQMPMDKLVIYDLHNEKTWQIDSLKSYKLAENTDWLAYQCGRKDSALHITSLDGKQKFTLPNVSAYGFAHKNTSLYFVTPDSIDGRLPGIYVWTPDAPSPILLKSGKGVFTHPVFDENGQHLAFLYAENNKQKETESNLWLSSKNRPAQMIAETGCKKLQHGRIISLHTPLRFSKDGNRLFFGTASRPLQKDTTVLKDNRPNVQIWSGNEPVQYTVQLYNLKKDLKKGYAAVYNLPTRQLVQLADSLLPDIVLPDDGMGDWAIISTSLPYSLSSMWEGRTRSDYYKVSLSDGSRTPISFEDYATYRLSPTGRYAYAYNETDSCWRTIDLKTDKQYRLTTSHTFKAWNEENDMPDHPNAYGTAGWTKNDEQLLIYDRYDIWAFSPTGKDAPVNLTLNGRSKKRSYRIISTNKEKPFVDMSSIQLLIAFDERTKANAFYQAEWRKRQAPVQLTKGEYKLGNVLKARDADRLLFTQENFETYPDIHSTDLNFRKPVQLTKGISQQAGYRWGTAELMSWISLDGDTIEGIVYKPTDFNPSKKYPMIVNFYERNAETLHEYHMPEAHRSTIDYHLYLSNGYVIFNPDIRYKMDGYPGEDCYNCLMPGISALSCQGYIDMKHIGAQGHSWGGYQVAYLATRTNLFAAIESGAPVVNMFSAYGGIRWGSGLNRSFQYEHTQSRIGGTPWEAPVRYFENSPLFLMDKVHTPILIMHNDNDGHVPWYQGIEYFIALKRLQKPVWMLNYTGEVHWPLRLANKIDFQTRMFQFFNHYLKDAPMPKWMKEGIPAVRQEYESGY